MYLALDEGEENQAKQLLIATVELCKRVAAPQKQALYLGLLAEVCWRSGESDRAIVHLGEASEAGEGTTASHAVLMSRMGRYENAGEWLRGFHREEADPMRRLHAMLALARLYWWTQKASEGTRLCAAALEFVRPSNCMGQMAPALVLDACLASDYERAIGHLAEATEHCGRHVIGDVILDVGTLFAADPSETTPDLIQRYLELSENVQDWGILFRVEALRSQLFAHLGDAQAARASLATAHAEVARFREQLKDMALEHRAWIDEHPWIKALPPLDPT